MRHLAAFEVQADHVAGALTGALVAAARGGAPAGALATATRWRFLPRDLDLANVLEIHQI